MRPVTVGNFTLDENSTPFFVAELGICHGGDVEVALELTRAAAAAGAHCVKTETFQRETLVFAPSAVASYCLNGEKITVPLAEHMDRYGLTFDEHHRVKLLCDELGLPFMSTAHDFESVDFLVNIGASAIKIASPDIVHYPLLRYVAGKGLPVFLDTGAAMQYEIELAVQTLRDAGLEDIVVNHNPAGHPAPAEGHDLRIIRRLADILEVPIGLADHYEGYEMAYAAVIAGAHTVEKPISMDRYVAEAERNYSISVEDLPEVVANVAKAGLAMGKPARSLTEAGREYRNNNRSAVVAAHDLGAGETLTLDNVIFGRPRHGIGVEHWDLVVGRRLRSDVGKHAFIQWEDVE